MTAGLPGAGIGGVFYLLAALLAPVVECVRAIHGDGPPRQWGQVLRHFLLAVSILSGMWLTGWLIGVVLTSMPVGGQFPSVSDHSAYTQVIGRRMALFTVTTLAAVLLGVEGLRLSRSALKRWRRRTTAAPLSRRPLSIATSRMSLPMMRRKSAVQCKSPWEGMTP